ncbi:acyltransferase family protein [Massilia sp. TSP1-1-2]|uniref:acyltransferase family protein n=1 Tax=unclassified Massilia TaxID=2609279 RepID=UPI003CFB594E
MDAAALPRLRLRLRLLSEKERGNDSWHLILIAAVRGLAALQVAAAHLRSEFFPSLRSLDHPALWYQALLFFTGFAHQAALVFFLISGYLVGGSLLDKLDQPDALKLYAIDRITRLWTVLIPAFVLILAFGIVTGTLAARHADFAPANPYSVAAFAGNLAGLQTISVPPFGNNAPLWSLSYTSWYYLLFPLLVLCVRPGRAGKRLLPGALLLLAALWLPSPIVLYFSLWLLGAGFSRVRLECTALTRVVLLAALGTLCVTGRLTGSNEGLSTASYPSCLLLSVLFLLFLSSTVIKPNPDARLLAPLRAAAHCFSRFSFTLYVVHLPVLGMLGWLGVHLFDKRQLAPDSPANLGMYCAMLAMMVLFAYGFYRLFEARTCQGRRWLKGMLSSTPLPNRRAAVER